MDPRSLSPEEIKYKQFYERKIIIFVSKYNFEILYHMMYPQYIYPKNAFTSQCPKTYFEILQKYLKSLQPVFQTGELIYESLRSNVSNDQCVKFSPHCHVRFISIIVNSWCKILDILELKGTIVII